jgi:UDP-glucose 4-epimerase
MRYSRVLVTGGAGFIGSHLVERLVRAGVETIVLDDLSVGKPENLPSGVTLIRGDVRDPRVVDEAVSGVQGVFHLAARVSIRASVAGFHDDAETNLMGTLNVLQACATRSVNKLVYASSMAVYADSPRPTPIPESYDTAPLSPYGVAKLACERYIRLVSTQAGFKAVCLRYFNTYGPRQTFTPYVGVMTIFIQRLLRGEAPTIFGDGQQCRDFVYVGDVADATHQAMLSEVSGEVINVGSGEGTTVNRIASLLCSRLSPSTQPVHVDEHVGEVRNSIADIRKAQRLLGYEPKTWLEDKLDEIIAWNRQVLAEKQSGGQA